MNKLLRAALSQYEAQRDEALAVLEVYFNNSVGIGEHSNLLKRDFRVDTKTYGSRRKYIYIKDSLL